MFIQGIKAIKMYLFQNRTPHNFQPLQLATDYMYYFIYFLPPTNAKPWIQIFVNLFG